MASDASSAAGARKTEVEQFGARALELSHEELLAVRCVQLDESRLDVGYGWMKRWRIDLHIRGEHQGKAALQLWGAARPREPVVPDCVRDATDRPEPILPKELDAEDARHDRLRCALTERR